MEKANKNDANYLRGTYNLIAKKVGCSRKYVRLVLENKLGKYGNRDTRIVKEIREMALKIEEMFN
jgi:hypothetical protein